MIFLLLGGKRFIYLFKFWLQQYILIFFNIHCLYYIRKRTNIPNQLFTINTLLKILRSI